MSILITIISYYTASLIVNILLTTFTRYAVYKYLAGAKYKMNDLVDDPSQSFGCIFNNMFGSIKWIPLLNLLGPIILLVDMAWYNKEEFIDKLDKSLQIIPMNKEEIEKYNKNPNIFTATSINNNSNETKESIFIAYSENGKKNTIYFDIIGNNYVITKLEGPIKDLSILEQKSTLIELLCSFTKKNVDKTTMDDKVDGINSFTIEERRKLLLQYKDYILNTKSNDEEEVNIYVKCKK